MENLDFKIDNSKKLFRIPIKYLEISKNI